MEGSVRQAPIAALSAGATHRRSAEVGLSLWSLFGAVDKEGLL